jgi:glycosyltransferase involved in cell wall biosynthesis
MPEPVDVALVSLGTTPGLTRADEAFAAQLRASGMTCDVCPVSIGAAGRLRRHPAVTDLVEATAARRALRGASAGFTVFSAVTSALLQHLPAGSYAVRFDAPAALNRPGAAGAWQRRAERRVLGDARVLLPWSDAAGAAAPGAAPRLTVPVPVAESPGEAVERDIHALAYAGNPRKRGLDRLCSAWTVAPAGSRLLIGGIGREAGLRFLRRAGVSEPAGVEWRDRVSHAEWLAMARRARLFVNASVWEDYGISQLEALSAGAALVTVPSPGPYEALPIARRLEPGLVDDDLSAALGRALAMGEQELGRYRAAAAAALAPYRPDAVLAVVRDHVIPLIATA